MDKLHFAYRYFRHFIDAKNTKGHGIHSPYLYRFTHNAIYEKNPFYVFSEIETLRENLHFDDCMLSIKDYGTGNDREMKVSEVAKQSLKKPRWAQVLFRVAHFTKAKNILELGTSLGLSTSYMASVSSDVRCITLEGSSEIAKIARENFEKLLIKNIELIEGNIDDTLPVALQKLESLDLVYFDANHSFDATMRYFEQCLKHIHAETVFIFDDIYWSKEMLKAWNTIRRSEKVTASIDLFQFGIVFFNPSYPKRTYKMKLLRSK